MKKINIFRFHDEEPPNTTNLLVGSKKLFLIQMTNNSNPLVSIITPNYNCGRFISETIESVLAQTYTNWEMIIVDDCSGDNSLDIVRSFAARDKRIRVYRNESNLGGALTRNRAIELSNGEYLAFLDSDDIWLPDKLSVQLRFMSEHHCDFCFTRYEHISESGESLLIQARVPRHLTYSGMLRHCWPGCLTVVYRQDVANKIYARDIKKNNDHALFLRVLRQCRDAYGIDECTALYRIREGSVSRNKWKMLKPFITTIHKFEQKSMFTALCCVVTHMFVKTFMKYERIKPEQSVACIYKKMSKLVIGGG